MKPEKTQSLSVSIVTFNNKECIGQAIESIRQSTLWPLPVVVVDNGSTDGTIDLISREFPDVTLILSENIGFGAGHNKAIASMGEKSRYHLIMNPDIYFDSQVLESLLDFMEQREEIGLVMPQIRYPDDSLQYLCKLLPTPFDLIGRRFLPSFLKSMFRKGLERYEMKDRDYEQMMEVPHLSGCFMFLRGDVFEKVGVFDDRYFMYLEDVDFSRRIHRHFKTVYFPGIHVYHQYHKGSYKRWNHLKYHIGSAVKYFNKWGWFFDQERRIMNRSKKELNQYSETLKKKVDK